MTYLVTSLSLIVLIIQLVIGAKLSTSGTDFMYDGQKVYLSGVNIAWNDYGNDFGNGGYDGTLESFLADISAAGGNTIRMWVHVEGKNTPIFDTDGYVTSCDTTGQFISDVKQFLDVAQSYDILVILVLWNGAAISNDNYLNLIWDDTKLDSYFDSCLTDFILGVQGHPALGAWETTNEPEGAILLILEDEIHECWSSEGGGRHRTNRTEYNSEPCYDTSVLQSAGAGWVGTSIPMERFLRFIGRHNELFKSLDPSTLTTIGSWSQYAQTTTIENSYNYYTDECLNLASGGTNAGIDFQQMHTYQGSSSWTTGAPFTMTASDYALNKPLVLGEYSSDCGMQNTLEQLNQYAYDNGYNGGLSWHWVATGGCSDTQDVQRNALSQLTGQTANGVVDFTVA